MKFIIIIPVTQKLLQDMLLTFLMNLNPTKLFVMDNTYERVHVLFITNYVKYIKYFKESILPN